MDAYIVGAVRAAGGRRNGRLANWHPVDLAAQILNAAVDRAGIPVQMVDDVIMGCVGQAGEQSNNIARLAVMASNLPLSVPGVSIDRQCGSSQQALHFAAQAVASGAQDIVIAAGVESMSRAPMGSSGRFTAKPEPGSPFSPLLAEKFPGVVFSQFSGAEAIARKYGFTRYDLDAFALKSHQKAIQATSTGAFTNEIVPIAIPDRSGEHLHTVDEGIRSDASLESIASVKLLTEGGVISAASSSQICDGASAVVVVSERIVKSLGLKPLAKIHSLLVTAGDPVIMLEEPLFATKKALQKAGLSIADIDLFEVNEAFAPIPMAWLKYLEADPTRLNVNGGAIALGHPLGASGTKLMATLVHALRARGGRYGLQTMCEGGGMANVTIIEAL